MANFISLLVQKVGVYIKPFTPLLLKLLLSVVRDEKGITSKRAFANACALVLKYAAPSQAQILIEDSANLHSGDRNDQISCALLLKSFASMAVDVLSGYHAIIVPVIFVSRLNQALAVFQMLIAKKIPSLQTKTLMILFFPSYFFIYVSYLIDAYTLNTLYLVEHLMLCPLF